MIVKCVCTFQIWRQNWEAVVGAEGGRCTRMERPGAMGNGRAPAEAARRPEDGMELGLVDLATSGGAGYLDLGQDWVLTCRTKARKTIFDRLGIDVG